MRAGLRRVSGSLWAAVACAAIAGIAAAAFYHGRGLTLSHDDAKAHLVVARRIFDSIEPGWRQIGAVWLPLPHLLNAIPVQSDWMYRTGLSAVALSIAGFVLASASLWWLVHRATSSRLAAWAALAMFAAHPDVLYLQSTPLTEPLLMGLALLGVARLWGWVESEAATPAWPTGVALAAACLTRYEAWPITFVAVLLAGAALTRLGVPPRRALRRVLALSAAPAAAVIAFLTLSHATVGAWLVTDGFYKADPSLDGRPLATLAVLATGLRAVHGAWALAAAAAGLALLLIIVRRMPSRSPLIVTLAFLACLALPAYAFWSGHPFRLRFMTPLAMAVAVYTGIGIGLLTRGRRVAFALVVLMAAARVLANPGDPPTVWEARWNEPQARARLAALECLRRRDDGTPILASMASLAPFMQETAREGVPLRRYIHEGIWSRWHSSLVSASRYAGWVAIDERHRDPLAQAREASSAFLQGFSRVCYAGGVSLYRKRATDDTDDTDDVDDADDADGRSGDTGPASARTYVCCSATRSSPRAAWANAPPSNDARRRGRLSG